MTTIKTPSFELAVYARGDKNAEKIALVLPGRLDTKDYAHCTSHVDYLATKGYFAVSFDPPGTWESPGSIDLHTTTTYLKAVDEVIEHFGNKPTLLVGHSRGGTVSMLATRNPAVSGIVAVMATYGEPSAPSDEDLKLGYHLSYRDMPPGTEKTKEQKRFELPFAYFEDGQKYDPVSVLMQLTRPKLLIYGDNDDFTKPERVKEVFAAIPEPKMLHEVSSEHDYRLHAEVIEEVNRVIGEFLGKYLA